jgi:hypothetical protein
MDSIGIEVRARGNPLRHFIANFEYFDPATSSVTILWKDARNLVVKCTGCMSMSVLRCERHWQDVTIRYAWQDGSPMYPPTTFSKGVESCGESARPEM